MRSEKIVFKSMAAEKHEFKLDTARGGPVIRGDWLVFFEKGKTIKYVNRDVIAWIEYHEPIVVKAPVVD